MIHSFIFKNWGVHQTQTKGTAVAFLALSDHCTSWGGCKLFVQDDHETTQIGQITVEIVQEIPKLAKWTKVG